MANKLLAGFGRVNITPPLGIGLAGYFRPRIADGILDELETNALALKADNDEIMLISIDNIGFENAVMKKIRESVSERTGIPEEAVFVHCTHPHTGPRPALVNFSESDGPVEILKELLEKYPKTPMYSYINIIIGHTYYGLAKIDEALTDY